jgi:ABC-type glycerol-3-phosphate transport system substrate-binding protein
MPTKKTTALVMASTLVGVLAAGCGSTTATAPTPKASGPVTITFMEAMSSGTLKPAVQALVSQFENSHKNITVDLEVEPSYSVLETKIEASVTAGQAPTIAQAYEDWAAGYANSGAIVPLDSYVNGSNGITAQQKSQIWSGVWKDQFLPDGKIWMWPFNKSDFVLYYNQTWLNQRGLPVPTTWSQFASDAQAVTSSSANTWGVSIDPGSSSGAANGTYFYVSLIRAYGGHLMKNGKPNFDSTAAQEALSYIVHMYQNGSMKFGSSYPGQTALGAKHGLFDLSTIASYYYDQEAIGGKFTMGVAAFPKGPAGEGNVMQGTNIVMFSSASTAQKNAAWTFMKWLSEPAQTAYWATHTGYLPVTKAALPLMTSYFNSHPYQKIAAESLAYARPTPPVAGMDQGIGALANAIQEATIGHRSVATALAAAQSQATSDVNSAQ